MINPKRFKRKVGKYNDEFEDDDQKDAAELLGLLLDTFHEDLNKVNANIDYPKYTDDNLSDEKCAEECWKL